MFRIRYEISKAFIYLGLYFMPGTRYKTELLKAMYELKERVAREVSDHEKDKKEEN